MNTPTDIENIPPEDRDLVLSFLGHTYAKTQEIDNNIVDGLHKKSGYIRETVGKVLNASKAAGDKTPVAYNVAPTQGKAPAPSTKDPNQLEFTFETVKADDVFNALQTLTKDIKSIKSLLLEIKTELQFKNKEEY